MANLVKFITCTAAQYVGATKDSNTLYFVSDTKQFYKGEDLYSGGKVQIVDSFPVANPEINTIYAATSTSEVKFYNGTSFVDIVVPVDSIIEDTENTGKVEKNGLATAQAVFDYVKALASGDVADLKAAIDTLNGEKTEEGSVKKTVADAIAEIVANAPEDLDTLKEISDWITDHADDAAAMNTQIQTNKTDIENLAKLVGELPEDATAEDVVAYIKEYADSTAGVQAVTSGSANGTIDVDGTDVAVTGLDTAAYKKEEDFDAAGAAADALIAAKGYIESLLTWGTLDSGSEDEGTETTD